MRRSGIPYWNLGFIQQGGGAFRDMGVHALDAAWWVMGCPAPATVTGVAGAKFGPRGQGYWDFTTPPKKVYSQYAADDYAGGMVRFENGAALQVESFWASHQPEEFQIELFGTEAGARLRPLTVYRTVHGAPQDVSVNIPKGGPGGPLGDTEPRAVPLPGPLGRHSRPLHRLHPGRRRVRRPPAPRPGGAADAGGRPQERRDGAGGPRGREAIDRTERRAPHTALEGPGASYVFSLPGTRVDGGAFLRETGPQGRHPIHDAALAPWAVGAPKGRGQIAWGFSPRKAVGEVDAP